jgi:cytochrome P450
LKKAAPNLVFLHQGGVVMAKLEPFTPPYPLRVRDWPNAHMSLIGERSRDSAWGWPDQAFEVPYKRRQILNHHVHLINDPEMIGHVLLTNHHNYIKPDFLQLVVKSTIGRGLFTAEKEEWRLQRKIVAPTFAPSAMTDLNARLSEVAAEQITRWPSNPTRIDMATQALRTTLLVISNTLFSGDPRLTSPESSAHLEAVLAALGKGTFSVVLGLPEFSLTSAFRRGQRGRKYLRQVFGEMVDERVAAGQHGDFFGGLVRSLYESCSPEEARALAIDNALTFYVAGHETTSVALAWTSFLLAAQPELQEEARAEAVSALEGDIATLPDRLPLIRQIIEEALRLYPPVHRIERQAIGDDEINGVAVRKGDVVAIWPMVVHRHKLLWDQPDMFDHRRFTPEAKAQQHRFQYFPFGAGPRICIGARMAMAEALIVMAHWLAARRFETVPGHEVRAIGGVTLRPQHGMPLMMGPV